MNRTTRRRPALGRTLSALVALGAVTALVAGCSTAGAAAEGDGTPKDGGDLVFQIDSLGATWVPNSSSISSFQGNVWGEVTDKLLYVDEAGNLSPWVATSWDESADAKTFTIHLRDDVTFSDGSPVDAEAVVANIEFWAKGDPDKGIPRVGLFPSANYAGATALDPATVEVTFSAPTLGFIPTLAYHGSILVSPTTLALPADQQADLSNAIGSGPFTVESWKDGDSVVLTKRDDYAWGPEARGHTGPAHLDSITYKVVPEPSLRTASVQSNQADVAYNASPQELDALKAEGFTVAAPRYLGFVNGFALNTSVAPFDDANVRKAFQHGIDRDEILSTVYTSDWLAAESFIQSNVPDATDHSADFAFDPDESNRLLDEAGWVTGADGVRTKDGARLELTLHPNPYLATSNAIDELIAQQLARVGFHVSLQVYDVTTYGEKVTGNTAIQAAEITRSFVDAGTVAGVLTSRAEGDEDWFRLGTGDQQLVDLAGEVAGSSDRESRATALDALQGHVLQEAYFAPITQIAQRIYVTTPDLHGVTYNGLAYASFATAWLDR